MEKDKNIWAFFLTQHVWLILPVTFPLLAQEQKHQLKNNLSFSGSFFKIEASDEVIKSKLSSGHVYTCTGSATSTASSTFLASVSFFSVGCCNKNCTVII